MAKQDFFTDTEENIEKLYKDEILKLFPNYAVFWNEFIGQKVESNHFKPYGLIIANTYPQNEIDNINYIYERMTMAHYTLFCSLASAHYQYSLLTDNYNNYGSETYHFKHWDSFENIYLRLGNAFYQVYHLWKLFFAFKKALYRQNPINMKVAIENIKIRPEMKQYYSNGSSENLVQEKFQDANILIKAIRDESVHFSRIGVRFEGDNAKYYLPFNISKNINWSDAFMSFSRGENMISTDRLACKHILTTEISINELHELLIQEISNIIASMRILIDY